MYRQTIRLCVQSILPNLLYDLIDAVDLYLDFVYKYIELPLQNVCYYFGTISLCYYRRRSLIEFSRNLSQILIESYAITIFLYFVCLLIAQLFSIEVQRHYFLDPLLSSDRQCVNIKFVRIDNDEFVHNNMRLRNNFIRENYFIGNESLRKEKYNYARFYQLLELLENSHYMICQRSLYIYARFQAYSSLLHSNHSQFRFFLPQYLSSFSLDQPPFIDLCVHTSNGSQLDQIKSHLLPLSSHYYSSVNLFFFNFNFTQVTVTLYQLNSKSPHLERTSIHTGWLCDIYSKYQFVKYSYALSTVLFDGLSSGQHFIDYFGYEHIPVPADPLLGLNEMIQQGILVLPLCNNK